MSTLIHVLTVSALTIAGEVKTDFLQVSPIPKKGGIERSAGQDRAVVLIHGLRAHPFSTKNVTVPGFQDWQQADSTLVKALAKEADVFSFAYGQDVVVDAIPKVAGLQGAVCGLRDAGYSHIVLVGHSAGGLIARHFVEDNPKAGVTKVIQVCTPNGGSSWGKMTIGVRESQEVFLTSLTKDARMICLKERKDKRIPEQVQFVCLVGIGAGPGDGFVLTSCQWTEDLQEQGIPVALVDCTHFLAMRGTDGIHKVVELVRTDQVRWDTTKVSDQKKKLFEAKPTPRTPRDKVLK